MPFSTSLNHSSKSIFALSLSSKEREREKARESASQDRNDAIIADVYEPLNFLVGKQACSVEAAIGIIAGWQFSAKD